MEEKYSFDNGDYGRLMTSEEAFVELEDYIDASDPDRYGSIQCAVLASDCRRNTKCWTSGLASACRLTS